MRKSVKYQIECIKRKRIGQSAPRPLKIVNGLASSVLTDKKIANPTIQHSQAAAQAIDNKCMQFMRKTVKPTFC